MKFRSGETAGLMALLALATALRIPGLNSELWHDELAMLVELVRQPLRELVTSFPSDNNHPLYTLLAWVSVRAFGESPWVVRLPAVVFGVASIGALYLFGRRVTGRAESMFAAALLTLSYHHVWFSQNARGYTGLLLFTILSCYWFLQALEEGSRRARVLFGVTLALGTYVHLTAVYVGIAQLLVYAAAVGQRSRSSFERRPSAAGYGFIVAGLVSLALHAPILPQMIQSLFFRERRVTAAVEWTSPLWTLLETARSLGGGPAAGLIALTGAAVVCALGLWSYWRRSQPVALLFVLPGIVGALAALALGRNLWPRFFFFLSGFGVLVVTRGLMMVCTAFASMVRRRRDQTVLATRLAVVAGAIVLVASASMLPRNYRLPKQDFAGALAYVGAVRQANEPVMTGGLATFTYRSYYGAAVEPVSSMADLDRVLNGQRRGYLLYTFPIHFKARYPELWNALARRGHEVRRFAGTVGDGDIVVLRIDR